MCVWLVECLHRLWNVTAHERTSQASTGSREQAHTEPCWRAANVEVRWKKWCMSKTEQSCRQSNRLCKSSPYFLCDYGEKEAKRQNAVPAGGLPPIRDSRRGREGWREGGRATYLRKSTKIYENQRKSMKICENLRKSTKIDDNLLKV